MIPNSFTPERREVFFQVLEDTCSPKQAAAAAGISRNTAFYHKANDHEFRSRWDKAVEVALDALLDEAYRRAALGYDEPVIHQGRVATVADPETGEERPLTGTRSASRWMGCDTPAPAPPTSPWASRPTRRATARTRSTTRPVAGWARRPAGGRSGGRTTSWP